MIKVSVIVQVYNSEAYLRECLDSLVSQTLDEIEIILCDDASDDSSAEIMEEYRRNHPEKIRCIYNRVNQKGFVITKNIVPIAEGRYIACVNDDDYIAPDMLEKLYQKAAETNFEADIVYGDFAVVDSNGAVRAEQYSIVHEQFMGKLTIEKRSCMLLCESYTWGQIIKKELLHEHSYGKWDVSSSANRLLHADHIEKVPEKLYYFRQREGSVARKSNNYGFLWEYGDAVMYIYALAHMPWVVSVYRDVLMARFMLYYYYNQLKMCAANFDEVPLNYLRHLQETVKKLTPDYHSNEYLCNRLEPWQLQLIDMNTESPESFKEQCKQLVEQGSQTWGKDLPRDYVSYYKISEKIKDLFAYCNSRGFSVSLWGLGERGAAFLECYSKDICNVIDKDCNKWGTMQNGVYVSPFDAVKNDADVILVTNSGWYHDIKEEIRRLKGSKAIYIVDVETLIKYPISVEEMMISVS